MTEITPLPESVNLLSNSEILSLIKDHNDKLQLYIDQFISTDTLQRELTNYKEQLLQLRDEFIELQKNIDVTNTDLDDLRILNSKYTKRWQDLNQVVNHNYSEHTLKSKLENKISYFEVQSDTIESNIMSKDTIPEDFKLDESINDFLDKRTNYHLNKEILLTWNHQGQLKK
ncbi:hypothetical protein C6P45_004632 [Maudiozyma exigua]|uniref:VPS37 C-terminal domain-containing protein n=1 Tax=Maudiozyma exigua TaxID=34358 RepID=A0A9P7BA88_MAUEX|nr:hypothetical protein C6P45_004632 [Kazachstania exigua]